MLPREPPNFLLLRHLEGGMGGVNSVSILCSPPVRHSPCTMLGILISQVTGFDS